MQKNGLKLESFWTRRSGLLTTIIAVVVFAVNLLQDIFLSSEGFSRWGIVVLSDIITGAIAGALFYQFAKNEKNRRELIRERMHTIAELNHHIRNALQVIKFWGAQHQNCTLDEMQIRLMKDSVDRIEWALREVLPKYPTPSGLAVPPSGQQITSLAPESGNWPRAAEEHEEPRPAAENEQEEQKTNLH
ncbi:MAG TPA: hypothetical protein VJV96_19805 [Candidatus Angelobacter sp.]|nr:hypothetical protein [Candidatus Angelobacter sp.]